MGDATLEQVKAEIMAVDDTLVEGSEVYDTALVLLSSVEVGPNVTRLCAFTGLPRTFVGQRAKRFRANRVWRGSKVAAAEWFEEGTGGIAFLMDVAVGMGLLERPDA